MSLLFLPAVFLLFFLLCVPPVNAAAPDEARAARIGKAESYLRDLDKVRARFIQKSDRGLRLSGVFYMDRPGKLRFEYDQTGDFVVADGLLIYFYDAELGEQTHAPIGMTLADFLLRADTRLDDDILVREVENRGGFTHLTLVQREDPLAGSLQLVFSNAPYRLKKWLVTDPQGLVTEVELHDLETQADLDDELFVFRDPKARQGRYND